jgi:alginate O-acetyltransferase complex protein AlgI
MNFVSTAFLFFLVSTASLFIALPANRRMPFLLLASYFFYATWSFPFLAIILLTTTTDYWMSRIISRSASQSVRKTALIAGLVTNLIILGFFKYCNFFLDTGHGLAHWLGYSLDLPKALQIALPLGISFYTFEAISYMVDVYRGKEPARNWLEYNFYIMYFPHLISGPIVRFSQLTPQYRIKIELPSISRMSKGFELILLGYIFKIFIADNAASLADPIFNDPGKATVFASYLAAVAFTVQIYFDFMGYTHIARGASLLLNIEMPLNFNHPYHASNISNFWERWHISLSSWIRDYLYFPLGGSRGSMVATVFNLMVTMLICGAWHGAGWTYILWGGYHGVLLSGYHIYKKFRGTQAWLLHGWYQLFSSSITYILVVLGWVIFRSPDFGTAAAIFEKLGNVSGFMSEVADILKSGHLTSLCTLLLLLGCCFSGPAVIRGLSRLYQPLPFWVKVHLACILAILGWVITSEGVQPFIYFQF